MVLRPGKRRRGRFLTVRAGPLAAPREGPEPPPRGRWHGVCMVSERHEEPETRSAGRCGVDRVRRVPGRRRHDAEPAEAPRAHRHLRGRRMPRQRRRGPGPPRPRGARPLPGLPRLRGAGRAPLPAHAAETRAVRELPRGGAQLDRPLPRGRGQLHGLSRSARLGPPRPAQGRPGRRPLRVLSRSLRLRQGVHARSGGGGGVRDLP